MKPEAPVIVIFITTDFSVVRREPRVVASDWQEK
jgi:hypothetical protein